MITPQEDNHLPIRAVSERRNRAAGNLGSFAKSPRARGRPVKRPRPGEAFNWSGDSFRRHRPVCAPGATGTRASLPSSSSSARRNSVSGRERTSVRDRSEQNSNAAIEVRSRRKKAPHLAGLFLVRLNRQGKAERF